MTTQFDGGILGGFLQGMRMGEQDSRSRQTFEADQIERQTQRQRQSQNDARTAQEFDWRREDRAGEVAHRDQQRDLQALHADLAEFGFDEKKIAASAARNKAQLGRAFQFGAQSGDWSPLIGAFNQGPGSELGVELAALTYNPDGKGLLATTASGETMEFADIDQLGAAVASYGDPAAYSQGLVGTRRGRNQPAALQQAEAIFERLRPLEDESEDDRWMRAYEISRQSRARPAAPRREQPGRQPAPAASRADGGPMARMLAGNGWQEPAPPAAGRPAPSAAAMSAMRPGVSDRAADGFQQRNASGLFGQSVMSGAAGYDNEADTGSRGRVLRTGRRPDGTRVAEYADGTIAPL